MGRVRLLLEAVRVRANWNSFQATKNSRTAAVPRAGFAMGDHNEAEGFKKPAAIK